MCNNTFLQFKTTEPRTKPIKAYGTQDEFLLLNKAAEDMNLTAACLIRNAIGEYLINHDLTS